MNQAQEVPVGKREKRGSFIRRERGRLGQGAIFAIILICFFLPFLNTSCADERAAEAMAVPKDAAVQEFTGWQLLRGSEDLVKDNVGRMGVPDQEDLGPGTRTPAEPWAQSAFAAALVGLIAVLLKRRDLRMRVALICSLVVVFSFWLLVWSPSLRKTGLMQIDPQIGYWIALGTSIASAVWFGYQATRAGPDSARAETLE